ncbi:MAG: hypothetical protein CML02_04310 [Pseudooceanicola sp.]|nr:hypothetical protein [Pseudooceanicola sp.]
MAGESFLLSGDQIATYGNNQMSYPDGVPTIKLNSVKTLGDADSRFFLVRTQGDGDQITNGQFWTVYPAVSDGAGGLMPGPTPVFQPNYATPDGYEGAAGGDSYNIFGMFGGTKFAVNLDGFQGAKTFTATRGEDKNGGNYNGETDLAELAAANPDGGICFLRGTPVDTPDGPRLIETLKPGDMVLTADKGAQPLRWVAMTRVRLGAGNRDLAPVRIKAGALGGGLPLRDICVSPAHRVLLSGPRCELLLGVPQALCPARMLLDGVNITHDPAEGTVEYWHLLFDDHEILTTSGMDSESFHPGARALGALDVDARSEVLRLFPQLAGLAARAPALARPVLRAFEARAVLGRTGT